MRFFVGAFPASVVALLMFAAAAPAPAEVFPTKPIRFIVPYASGGSSDILARILGQHLAEAWGQPVIVENKPGAAGLLGADLVAKAPPDGYTIMLGVVANLSMAPTLHPRTIRYDPVKDFTPVATIANIPIMIAVSRNVPAQTLSELVAHARSRPGQLNFGSSGVGGFPHLSGELFKKVAEVDITHIPYRGSAQAVSDLVGGQIQILFDYLPSTMPAAKGGLVRALAIASKTRSPAAPDVPTATEAGVKDYEVTSWFGIMLPAHAPRNIVEKYHREIVRIMQLPDVRDQLARQGGEPFVTSPDEFARLIQSDLARWSEVIKAANIKSD